MTLTVAILEFVASGGLCHMPWNEIPTSLRTEGAGMLEALVMDLARSNIRPLACLDERFATSGITDPCRFTPIDPTHDWRGQWLRLARQADATVLIAPETDEVLLELCRWLRAEGIRIIASDEDFLRATTDKLSTAQFLAMNGIEHPDTRVLREWNVHEQSNLSPLATKNGFVVKNRDGAGCDAIQRMMNVSDVISFNQDNLDSDAWIVQPWKEGIAGSVSVLCGPNDQVILPASTQRIASQRSVRYEGGTAPWQGLSHATMTNFALRTLAAMPGQHLGWIGLDWVYTPDHELIPIEINPRLTTSIVGLKHLFSNSLAEAMIRIGLGESYSLNPLPLTVEWSTFPTFNVQTHPLS